MALIDFVKLPALVSLAIVLALLGGCEPAGDEALLGTLAWDRIGIPAEASETILSWQVAEGDRVVWIGRVPASCQTRKRTRQR